MRYDTPELRERLAEDYVLGTMPRRAQRRFERLMSADMELARMVGDWVDRLAPLDLATPPVEPPAHVWQAIERQIGETTAALPVLRRWFQSLAFWRALALASSLATAALVLYVAVFPRPIAPAVVAVLAGRGGEPGWVAVAGPRTGEVSVSAVAPPAERKPHAFELWAIAGGPPRPLGLLPQDFGSAIILQAAQLPPPGSVLAVSFEPPGGSPTGLPTGPVLYQGRVLIRLP
jgi:anti-sigma-K factor RskA